MRSILKSSLEKHGYIVVDECGSGEEGMKKFQELSPDLVTLDIMLPGMNGIETLKEIMEIDEDANVLMISSMGQESKIREAILAGARDFIVKPFNEETLIKALDRIF
jgi:two-component system chemotaxis response regulator CheY